MLLVQIQATCTRMVRSVTDGYLGGHSDRATPGSRPIEHERSGSSAPMPVHLVLMRRLCVGLSGEQTPWKKERTDKPV